MSNSSTSSSRSRITWRALAFAAGALATTAALYVAGGWGRSDDASWFRGVPDTTASGTREILLVGSSRVAAAVDPATFDSVGTIEEGRPVRAINLGMGYSTLQTIHFGLRSLARKGALRGRLVLLEAPGSMPDNTRWGDSWIVGDARSLLSRYLDPSDLPRLWRQAGMPASDKFLVSVEILTGLKNNFWRLRLVATTRAKDLLGRVGASIARRHASERADLVSRGGIRTDDLDREKIRQSAIEIARRQIRDTTSWKDWDSSVFADLVREVRAGGGRIALFEIPLCSYQQDVFRSPARVAGAAAFRSFAARERIEILRADTTYPDDAFPDLWHIGLDGSKDFSRRLAAEVGALDR